MKLKKNATGGFVKSQELEEIKSRHYKKKTWLLRFVWTKKCYCKQCVTLPLEFFFN